MNTASILLLIADVAALIGLLFALMFSYYFLLKRIASSHPLYYKVLGKPFLPTASRSILKTITRDSFNYRLLGGLLGGLPANFPNETGLRRSAQVVRAEMFIIIGLGIAGVMLACLL